MKALFLVDLYQLWSNFKVYGVFVLVAVGITAFSGPGESNLGVFFPMYAVFMCSMTSMSLLQLDETSRWNVCAQTLPCTRRDQVTDKYAVTLLSFAVTWCLFVLLYAVLAAMGRLAWQMMAVQSILLLVMGLLAPAVSLPTLFRWGSARGRVIYLAMVILLAAGIGGDAGRAGQSGPCRRPAGDVPASAGRPGGDRPRGPVRGQLGALRALVRKAGAVR